MRTTAASPALPPAPSRNKTAIEGWIVAAAVLLALVLRLPALGQNPWIDEVWSVGLARELPSWLDVFRTKTSNNHPLNTLVLRAIGHDGPIWLLRIHSFLAGLVAIVLAWRATSRSGVAAGACAALFFAGSFLLGVFSVEARGYALLVAFSLWAWLAVQRSLEAPGALAIASSWTAIVLGTLSQFLFVGTYAALVLVTAIDLVARSEARGPRVRRALLLHAVPCAFLVLLYLVSLRHVVNSGAPPWSWNVVALQTAAWGLALPSHTASVWVAAALVVLVLVLDFRRHDGRTLAERAFTPIAVLVVPALLLVFLAHEYVAPRYFLVNLAFLYLAAARVLGSALQRGGAARFAAVVLVLSFLVGSVLDLRRFTRLGRGPYREAVELMAAEDPTPVLGVTGTPDFEVRALLEYHARFLPPERRIAYVSGREIPRGGVEWAIVDRPNFSAAPPPTLSIGPLTYALRLYRPRYGPIGAEWAVYRRSR